MILIVAISLFAVLSDKVNGSPGCVKDDQCGWNAECNLGQCQCMKGYHISHNKKDCVDTYCVDSHCLECTNRHVCHRCVDFIEEETGNCLSECDTRYALMIQGDQVGKVCKRLHREGISMLYIAIIVGTGSGILLTILVALVCYFKFRTDRERDLRIKLMGKLMDKEKKQKIEKEVAQFQTQDNASYAEEPDIGRMSRTNYRRQIDALRPHFNTFLAMLKEAKHKSKSLPPGDGRVLIYRNISHQLCRVLTLLHDRTSPIPPDADKLLTWAARIHADYLRSHQPVQLVHSRPDSRNSSFRPEQFIVQNGGIPGTTPRYPGQSFKYERYQNSEDSGSHDFHPHGTSLDTTLEGAASLNTTLEGSVTLEGDREISEVSSNIQLLDNFTQPVDV